MSSFNSLSRFTPFQSAIFGAANIVFLSEETNPAADNPIALISWLAINSLARSAIFWVNLRPPSRGVSLRA